MNWYGVIKRIISLEFPGQKEDQFGVIDIDTTRYRYKNEPYILAAQAELVFYVNLLNKPGWSSDIALKPRDLFAMSKLELDDSIDQDLTNWTRSDKEGTNRDVSVITQVQAQAVDEPDDAVFDVDDEDDEDGTYIDDGVVAPVASVVQGQDDDFFI
ncbi:hypothetical protein PVAP13_6KG192912 [Panicum virgatum]|uniref:DUF4216 domain-containing protein n=1 Tax=Panicum virgatum TaxID=38727 RepID=A0A8T0RG43_PANVG|nr:hypothetical protein PVAP13_6KG192912 [Panicum virgatum]